MKKKVTTVTVEIPADLYREIEAIADTPRTGVPVRQWIRMLLREGVEGERRRKAMVASLGGAEALARAIVGSTLAAPPRR